MKKTKLTRSLLAACSIVALSAVMYGCAHTDSGPSQEELDVALAGKATAEANAADAADAQMKAEADAADAADAQMKAEADAADAADAQMKAEADAADAADAQADAETAQADAEAQSVIDAKAREDAEAQSAIDDKAREDAEAQSAIDDKAREDAEKTAQDLEDDADDAAVAAHMAKARQLFAALATGEYGRDASSNVGMVHVNGTEYAENIAVTATHGDTDMTTVTITYNDGTNPQRYSPDFAVSGAADEVAAEGWAGATLSRSDLDGSHTHDLTVYTDIAATAGPSFSETFAVNSAGALEILPMVDDADNYDANIDADPFTNTNFVEHNFNMDDGSDPDSLPNNYVGHRGTYAGAPGEYRCTATVVTTAADCSSRLDSLGQVLLAGDNSTWIFVPDTGATTMIVDGTYLNFGWWLRENLAPVMSTTGLAVRTFYGSSADNVYQLAVEVTGTAAFAGAAAGKFALVNGVDGTADGGHWTADAALMADFGDAAGAGAVSGTIDNFMTGDTERDWSVALLPTGLDVNTDGGATAAIHFDTSNNAETLNIETDAEMDAGTIWTMGSGDDARSAAASGNWLGTFYGTTSAGHSRNDGTPTSAAGEFFSQFGTAGRMVGAFGVNSTTGDTSSN